MDITSRSADNSTGSGEIKVVLDIDNALGIPVQDTDDAWALALALASPEIALKAVTTCAGNCRTWQSTANTLRLLDLAQRKDIPVGCGREAPLTADVENHFAYLEAKSAGPEKRYWEHLPPSAPYDIDTPLPKAHDLIIETIRQHPRQIVFVALGSMTNLAQTLVIAPDIAPQINRIVHMGGAFYDPENNSHIWTTPDIPDPIWRSVLRFNTLFDPEASALVFRSGIPTTLVPVNVTQTVYQTLADVERIGSVQSALHQHLYAYGKPWVQWSIKERGLKGAHLHDPLTLAVLIDPSLFAFTAMHIDTKKFAAGGFPWFYESEQNPQALVAVKINQNKFRHLFNQRLSTAAHSDGVIDNPF